MESKTINNIRVYAPQSRQELTRFAFQQKKMLIAVNAEKLLKTSQELKDLINTHIGYPDGIGAVWALRKKGFKDALKIPGCELWLDIVKAHRQDSSFYLVGGSEAVIQATVKQLKQTFPNIKIANYRNGYIRTGSEREALIEDVAAKKPEVVFVAMGTPKQERLMQALHQRHKAVYMGLGGSFDLYTGKVKRVPVWWIKTFKWEGLYRSINEITNIKRWKRQFIAFKYMYYIWFKKF